MGPGLHSRASVRFWLAVKFRVQCLGLRDLGLQRYRSCAFRGLGIGPGQGFGRDQGVGLGASSLGLLAQSVGAFRG